MNSVALGKEFGRRSTVPLMKELDKHLIAYALAAGAAGVGLMGAAQPATAEVIYTATNETLTKGGLFFDLNLDGVPDFNLGFHTQSSFTYQDGHYTARKLVVGGKVNASVIPSNGSVGALVAGSVIGSSRKFKDVTVQRQQMMFAQSFFSSSGLRESSARGNWKDVRSRFLGLKFQINGQTHYGWARLTVQYNHYTRISATLLGYAYETVADQSIEAGQTAAGQIGEAAPSEPKPQSSTLGALALGSAGRWR